MMKKKVKYLMAAFMGVAMLCGVNGCSSIDDYEDMEQIVTETGDKQIAAEMEDGQLVDKKEQPAVEVEEERIMERDNSEEMNETKTTPGKEHNDAENAASGGDLDVVVPDAADDDWYMKGNIYTDDEGNRLEVFFNDHGTLEFAVNGLSMYITTVDNFQQENNWKVYTCDDGTIIGYFPGEPAHIEICDGDYAGLYEAGGDKVR